MKTILSKLTVFLAVCLSQALLLPVISFGQYGSNDYVLSSQAQVDTFDPSLLEGKNLVISGADIVNIDRLTNLIQVNGLIIENNPLLTSLAPLNNLDSVKSELRIVGNSALSNIDGFSSLRYAGGLTIASNNSLVSISGFNTLLKLGVLFPVPGLIVQNNQSLITITGFNAITNAPTIVIDNNSKLTDVSGFQVLKSVVYHMRYSDGKLAITNNPELTNLDGFLAVTHLHSLNLSGNSKLKNVHGFSNWTSTYGTELTISNNALLEDLDGLSNLTQTFPDSRLRDSATIELDHNPLLTKPCGIHKILDDISRSFNASRINIEGSGFHMYQLAECGTSLPIPPAPIVALDFNQGSGTAPENSGIMGANFLRSAGTPSSSTNFPANVGGPYSFDFGTTPGNHYVESDAPIDGLKNLSAFTLTGWLNCKSNTAGSGGNRVISWIKHGGDGVDLVYQSNGSLRLGVDGWPDASPAFSSPGKVPTSSTGDSNNWIFFAVTYQSNGQVQFYFGNTTTDATLDVTRTYTGPGITGSTIGKLAIGAFNDATRNSSTYDRMFRGLIDDIQIFNASLNYEKILAIQHGAGKVILPSRPNPVVALKTSTSVTLQWPTATTSPWPSGYKIYKNGVLMNDGFSISHQGDMTFALITGLSPGTSYNFVVRAESYPNTVIDSKPVSVTTSPLQLHIEAENYNGSNGVVKQSTTVESTDAGDWIRFDNVDLGSGYKSMTVRYAKGNNVNGTANIRLGNPTTGTLIGTLTTSFTGGWGAFTTGRAAVTGGTGLQTIYVSWPSGEGNGNFDWFEFSVDPVSSDTIPPSVAPNLTLVSKTSSSVTLSWTAATDNVAVALYEVHDISVSPSVLMGTSTTTSITLNNLNTNTEYNFSVRAKDAANNYSFFSNNVQVYTGSLPTLHLEAESYNGASGVVKQTTAVGSTDGGDWIRFDNVNLASGYTTITTRYAKGNNINGTAAVRLGNPTTGTLIGTLTTSFTGGWGTFTTTSAPLTGGAGLQTVYVSFPSGEGNGNFDWFEFSGGSGSGDITPPSEPQNLALVAKASNIVTLTWSASTDNVGVIAYEVYHNLTQVMGTTTATSITLNNLSPNTVYGFSVRAKDAANNYSVYSAVLGVRTDNLPTFRLEAENYNGSSGVVKQTTAVGSTDGGDWIRFDNVNLGSGGYTTITTRYAKGNNINGTTVVRLGNPTTGTVIGTLTTSFTGGWGTFTNASAPLLSAVGPNTVYIVWPTGSGNGNFDWFEFSSSGQSSAGRMEMSVVTIPVVLDEEGLQNELYQNHPNPFANQTKISVSLKQSVKFAAIAVYDLTGRPLKNIEVMDRGETTVEINRESMPSGVYIYSLIVDGKVTSTKRMAVFE